MKVTIKDVALEAGVSKATVSRVLSNHPSISDETRKRVNEVIEKMKYKPNQTARNLARSQTRTLGIIFPIDANDSFNNPIYIQMMQGISKYALENNYYVMYTFGKDEIEERSIKEFSSSGIVDGIVILKSEENDKSIKYLSKAKFPYVVIGRPGEEIRALWVDNDNFGATFNIAEYLIEKGYKEIGFVGAKPKWTVAKDRLEGYKRALQVHNIAYQDEWIYYGETFDEQVGIDACNQMIQGKMPQAIIATDDLIAVGIQERLKEMDIVDIPVVGFNNTVIGQLQKPEISTVEIYGVRLGYEAARILAMQVEGNLEEPNHCIVDTQFIGRGKLKK